MSEILKIEKVIAKLPDVLDANTIYIVRVGTGYEMYVTDITGQIAHKLNDEKITQLKNRRINFNNILAMTGPFELSSSQNMFSIETVQENVQYQSSIPPHFGFQNMGIFNGETYKLILHYDYTKGSAEGDKIKVTFYNQNTNELQDIEIIDLSLLDSGVYKQVMEITANGEYGFVNIEYIFQNGSTSNIKFLSAGCYDKSKINEYDLFDDELIIPYNYFITGMFSIASNIGSLPDQMKENNKLIKNSGVNLLSADYSNPQEIYDYTNYVFDAPYEIVPGFDPNIKSWKFDVTNSNSESKVVFNLGGFGNDVLSPSLRLPQGKYVFSFYAKSSDNASHLLKFQLNSSIGIPFGVKDIAINSGLYQYSVYLELPAGNYSVQFLVNALGITFTNNKFLYIERMMLENISWQDFNSDGYYLAYPSPFNESVNNIGNTLNKNILENKTSINNLNTIVNNLSNNKLDKSDYVQHFKGVFPSYSALQSAYPTALDGDYAHIDSGQGFDRMSAIWDTSDSKWIVQDVNIGANTDEVPEGTTNLYFKNQRVLSTLLSGLNSTLNTAVLVSDTVISGISKLQGQINSITSNLANNIRSTVLTGLVLTNNSKITATDTVLTAFGKIQAQLNNINAGPMVWIDASTMTNATWNTFVDQTKTKLEFSVYNGMVYLKGYITTNTAIGSGGGSPLYTHKDPRFMVPITFYTGLAKFNLIQVPLTTLQGSTQGSVNLGQSALNGDNQEVQSAQALPIGTYYIAPVCIGVVKNP